MDSARDVSCLRKSEMKCIGRVESAVYGVVQRDVENKCSWLAHITVVGRRGAGGRVGGGA